MKQYKVIRRGFVEQKDAQLKAIAVSSISVIKENLSWEEAKTLKKANPGSEITQQHSVAVEPL